MPINIGDQAPDFSAATADGETISLADYRGKNIVVLFFYPRDNTSVCTKQACAFRDAYETLLTAGAVVLGASGDSAESHRGFAANQRLPFPLLSDADGKLRAAFGVPKTLWILPGRVTYVIDRQGIVRHIFNSQLDADRHVQEALAIVKRLSTREDEPHSSPKT